MFSVEFSRGWWWVVDLSPPSPMSRWVNRFEEKEDAESLASRLNSSWSANRSK